MTAYGIVRLLVAGLALPCGMAHAQLFRAYLATDGSDANPCTLPQPCRLLPAAVNAVASGGEIWLLDSANYNTGTVTIGKSVSILAVPGAVGSLVALDGGPAVSVAADGLKVALRNVAIGPVVGAPAGTHGVLLTGASTVAIEESLVANLPGNGVYAQGAGALKLSNTTLRNNAGVAIALENGASAMVASARMIDNAGGLQASGSIAATTTIASVSSSYISGGGYGVAAAVTTAAVAKVTVRDGTIERTTSRAVRSETGGSGTTEASISGTFFAENSSLFLQSGIGSSVAMRETTQVGNGAPSGTSTLLAGE